jgi:hypothetical protein
MLVLICGSVLRLTALGHYLICNPHLRVELLTKKHSRSEFEKLQFFFIGHSAPPDNLTDQPTLEPNNTTQSVHKNIPPDIQLGTCKGVLGRNYTPLPIYTLNVWFSVGIKELILYLKAEKLYSRCICDLAGIPGGGLHRY